MPRISQFFGITIAMFYRDHAPPHFHAYYQDAEALIDIRTFALIEGRLPPRQLGLAVEWAAKRQPDLLRNWDLARGNQPLQSVLPLE